MDTLWRKQDITTRSVSAENMTGEKGKGGMAEDGTNACHARELGRGWKLSPSLRLEPGEETTIADITGPGMIKHIWMTCEGILARRFVLRIYWEDETRPAVETPVGDFFASANREYWQINSLFVCRNPRTGYNAYFEMPFRKKCRVTMENLESEKQTLYYQIDYELRKIPDDMLYFHAQFRRANPHPYKEDFTILEKVTGRGAYVGTYMFWGITNNGWWGEGEIKFFMDGDREFPTICGTGTEDYFGGSYDFDLNEVMGQKGQYTNFSSPYCGFFRWPTDGEYICVPRFTMYRWHVTDPVYFREDLRVTIQTLGLGWRSDGRYLPLQSADISSVAYFYLDRPVCEMTPLPDRDGLEII